MADGVNTKCFAVCVITAAIFSLVLVVRIVAPLESAALTSQLASTAVSSPSSLAIVLESWVGQVMGGNGPAKNAHVYHRERLRLLANPKRLKASGMATVWGEDLLVDPSVVPWQEYPRPQLERGSNSWQCLNGAWDYAVSTVEDPDGIDGLPGDSEWVGQIRVPFAVESLLSGVQMPLPLSEDLDTSDEREAGNTFAARRVALWYRRRFNLPVGDTAALHPDVFVARHRRSSALRYFLNFEAVDYDATVWVNGQRVGGHVGGFAPWSVEITHAVDPTTTVGTPGGTHEVVVRVIDSTDGAQVRGKQSKVPKGIWYTAVSGIWQTVWVEAVFQHHLAGLKVKSRPGERRSRVLIVRPTFAPPLQSSSGASASSNSRGILSSSTSSSSSSGSESSNGGHLRGDFGAGAFGNLNNGPPPGYTFRVSVRGMSGSAIGGQPYYEAPMHTGFVPPAVEISVPDPKLWSPRAPYLYYLECSLLDAQGRVVDFASSYTAIRDVGRLRDGVNNHGHLRLTLNGQPLFQLGVLDQGWWPDGLLTPPSDAAQVHDIEFLKAAGYNLIRKHAKVENRRFYYHCDRLGMLVWQDQPSSDQNSAERTALSPASWARLKPRPSDGIWSESDHAQFMFELSAMVDALEGHPSIVVWVPFNEAWGQHRTLEVGNWLLKRDPTRLLNVASGGNFWPVGHFADNHNYPLPSFPAPANNNDNNARNNGGSDGFGGSSNVWSNGLEAPNFNDFVKVVGEFGGHGLPLAGHLWREDSDEASASNGGGMVGSGSGDNKQGSQNWGYGKASRHASQLRELYRTSLRELKRLKETSGIAAGVYTQTTDVEGEINGLLTYDRKVAKLDPVDLKQWHAGLVEAGFEL